MNDPMLTEREKQTLDYYNQHAQEWAQRRKKISEPSFWDEELKQLHKLKVPQGKILEIGSGSGREGLELISMGYEYIGVDASQELLKVALKKIPASQLFLSTAYNLPFAPKTFDAFFSWAMLPHIPKNRIDEALFTLKNVLKPDAIGFIGMREGRGEKQEQETGRWFTYYQLEEFSEILQNHGFIIEKKNKKLSRANLVWLTFFVRMIKC